MDTCSLTDGLVPADTTRFRKGASWMLVTKDLIKIYGNSTVALKGINIEIPSGLFGLLGANGAGKTTLMRIMAGLLEPSSGQVFLDGHDLFDEKNRKQLNLGYLPQDFGFYPNLSGQEMLLHLLRLKGVSAAMGLKKLCDELLDRVNLADAAKRKVGEYSGGMKQRLGIAQAIAGDPKLIIADEPTAGLDPEERMRFYRILSELAADRTVVLSTHIVQDVAMLCPRFGLMHKGRLVTVTTPAEACEQIQDTIFEAEMPASDVAEFSKSRCVTQAVLVEGRTRVRIYQPDRLAPEGFTPVQPTLEDAYIVLTQASANAAAAAGGTQE